MEFIFKKSSRSLYFLTAFLFAITNCFTVYGQSVSKARKSFDSLNNIYYSGKLSEEEYLDRATELRDHYLLKKGVHFTTQELTDLLSLYRKIGWSKEKYNHVRKNYYIGFLNNAAMFEQSGAYMYYADKVAKEYKKNGEQQPFVQISAKSQIFMEQGLYDKVVSLYTQQKPYIKTLPELLRKNKIDAATGLDALTFISGGALASYVETNDTVAVYETEKLIRQIGSEVRKRSADNKQYMFYTDFFLLVTQYCTALFEKDHTKIENVFDKFSKLKITYKDIENGIIDTNTLQWKINHYISTKNIDSAGFYINKLENLHLFSKNQKTNIYTSKAQLQEIKGDFEGSNKLLYSALMEEHENKQELKAEIDELLYAFTQAENTKIDLQQAEAVKKQRTIWLTIISVSAVFMILSIYLLLLYRSRKAKAQIEDLNNTAEMQIIVMEESKHQAVRDEQQRLGQDLHDGLSSSIAAVRYQLESMIMDTEDIELKNKLIEVETEILKAYKAARTKSHEWYSEGDEQQQLSFEKQIRLITDKALPDNRYNKTIYIDNNSLINVSTDTRIALLRIVQESITNIIKHAKAKKVDILLYEEDDSLILSIIDDGNGFDSKSINKKSMLGLQSIKRRVQYLNGKEDIQSDKNGTVIKVSIPLTKI